MSFSQCLMCKYVFGRSCKLKNSIIEDEIYNNKIKCESFSSIENENIDCDDKCCDESKRFQENTKNHEKMA